MLTSSGGASAEVTLNNHTLTGEPSTTVLVWKEEGDVVDVPTGQDRQAPAEDGGGGKMASGVVGPGFTSESVGGAGTAHGPLAPSQGLLLHQVLTWSSALLSQGHPAGAARVSLPLDLLCLFPGPLRPPILLFPPFFS